MGQPVLTPVGHGGESDEYQPKRPEVTDAGSRDRHIRFGRSLNGGPAAPPGGRRLREPSLRQL